METNNKLSQRKFQQEDERLLSVISIISEHAIKPFQYRYDFYFRTIEVFIDVFKTILPLTFSAWIAIISIPNLQNTLSNYLLYASIYTFVLLIIFLGIRLHFTDKYINKYMKLNANIINTYKERTLSRHEMTNAEKERIMEEFDKIKNVFIDKK